MASENLAKMNDQQLMNLFAVTEQHALSSRAKAILSELEQRGYIYDLLKGGFATCEEWNQRHGDMPMDCEESARRLDRG